MRTWVRKLGRVLVGALHAWMQDQAPRLAAGLAYYTSFSIAPLLLVAILMAGTLYAGAETELTAQLTRLIPGGGAEAVQALLEGLRQNRGSGMAAGLGIVTLLFGATGVFGALQDALNEIWGVNRRPRSGLAHLLTRRLFSFAMVLGVAFLALVSLFVNSLLALLVARFGGLLPGGPGMWHAVNLLLALATATSVFALLYKVVPDVEVHWRPALVGALTAATLFSVGEVLLAWYLRDAARLSVYGVFGSLIVLLLWVYYSAQILLFGAEVAKVYASMEAEMDSPQGSGAL